MLTQACSWCGGHRRPGRCSSRTCLARGCGQGIFAFLMNPCARGCFTFRTAFARHVGGRLPRSARGPGRAGRGSESDTESDDDRAAFGTALASEDGVRAAMTSVYIDSDVLLRSSLLPARKHSDYDEPFSIVEGAEGLPNYSQPFFQARQEAAQQRVWLVVNLQHPDNAVCKTLNSDVWAQQDFCEDILVNKARLWQRDVEHFQAEQFIIYYLSGRTPSAEECPLVMILDPRTGRALRKWKAGSEEFPLETEKVLQRMNTFFDTHTLEGFSPPESPQHSPVTSPELNAADLDELEREVCLEDFEEITLTEAMMGDELAKTEDGQSSICGPFWDIVETTSSPSSGAASPATPSRTKMEFSAPAVAMPKLPVAPAAGEAAVNLLLRFPDGLRCERAFASHEPLANILEFAALGLRGLVDGTQAVPGADERSCTLADVLLEASPSIWQQQQQSLHTLPRCMPVGDLDIHRKVLNVRMRSQA